MMKNTILLFVLLLSFTSCVGSKSGYDATGTFEGTEIIVSSEVAGTVLEFNVTEGSKLNKGEIVGAIDSVQLYLQRQQLLQNIDAMDASRPAVNTQLAPLQKQLAKQRQEKTRIQNLLESGAATQKQLDDINSSIDILIRQIRAQDNSLTNSVTSTDARIAALLTQIEQVNDRINKCRIISPIDGTVLIKYVQAGELTSEGRPLMKVADMDNIFLKAYVTSSQLSKVKLGDDAHVRADFGGGNYREYPGKITWISDKSEFTPKNITTSDDRANMVYAMKIAVQNDGYLKLGMFGEVRFNASQTTTEEVK